MKRYLLLAVLLGWSLLSVGAAQAQAKAQWEEFEKRIDKSRAIDALGPDLFGDEVSLADGSLSFSATDVALPGNNALRVAFSRSYKVYNHWKYPTPDFPLGDWDLDVPSISGVFAPNWTIGTPYVNSADGHRCSLGMYQPTHPADLSGYDSHDFWHGNTLSIPGVVQGELLSLRASDPKPSGDGPYLWTTSDRMARVACLPSIKNTTGEGFLVVTQDGTKYWFDWMAQYGEPDLGNPGPSHPPIWARKKNVLYATKVQDRFGNTVTYTYTNAWNKRAKLTGIASSDGRQITIDYNGDKVSAVHAGSRSWYYHYNGYSLHEVILPDQSKWTIDFAALSSAYMQYRVGSMAEPARDCFYTDFPINYLDEPIGTMVHPSGAVGTFRIGVREHGRNNVPIACENVVTTGHVPPRGGYNDNDPNDDVNAVVISYHSLSLLKKTISGLTVPTQTWDYSYASDIGYTLPPPPASHQWPVCYPWGNSCLEPDCLSDSCSGSGARTTVTGPGGKWVRYTYGNSYNYNEGKLLKVERGSDASHILRTEANRYDLSMVDQAYPATAGGSARGSHEGFTAEYTRPLLQADILQQGVTFSRINQSFDFYARPLQVTKSSTLGYARTETTAYSDKASTWVMGQVANVTCNAPASCAGIVEFKTDYDPASALPIRMYGAGTAQTPAILQQTLTYRADGTVATVKDGNNNVITVSNWKRGIPQLIQYPATLGRPSGDSESAAVDNDGWIASTTDENGYTTGYGYDAMGRLDSIVYPTGDPVNWADTSLTFSPGGAPYGLPSGHWQQTVHTGNGYKVIHFDALWRPVVEETYDSGNASSTRSIVVKRYDAAGRLAFQSYPVRNLGTYLDPNLKGVHTEYDALDRVTAIKQDSELGLLASTTKYLSGFKAEVQNPRQQGTSIKTTSSYMAWDTPTTDYPVSITAPEGASTTIVRDAFGKPTNILRNYFSGMSANFVSREFYYDKNQLLCKTTEPETGTKVYTYDGAGNLTRTALIPPVIPGNCSSPATQNLSTPDYSPPIAADEIIRTYDARNRLKTIQFPDGRGDKSYSYYPDGTIAAASTTNGGTALTTTQYSYNRRRLLVGEQLSAPGFTWALVYNYNTNGHLSTLIYPNGLSVAFAPNALGQATQAGSYATGVSYHPNGGIAQFTYGNGIVHTMTQNTRQLPEHSRDAYGSSVAIDDTYDFDGNGNVAAITDALPGSRGNRTMAYDWLDRLTATTSPMYGSGATYSYDTLDNLTRVKIGGASTRDYFYCYDSSWHLTNIKTGSCNGATVVGLGYDERGNVKNKNGQLYDFDFGNRMLGVNTSISYGYDAMGRRVSTTSGSSNPQTTRYMYSRDGQLLYETGNDSVTASIYLAGSLVARTSLATTIPGANYVTKYQHTDALGSPVAVTDQNRVVIERNEYEPYGKVTNHALRDGPGYTGHVLDAATGLNYMQQRYYDPQIGRFLSVDPVTADGNTGDNFNRYWYANNNPYMFTDPDGRAACPEKERGCLDSPKTESGSQRQAAPSSQQRSIDRQTRSASRSGRLSDGTHLDLSGDKEQGFAASENGTRAEALTEHQCMKCSNGMTVEKSIFTTKNLAKGESAGHTHYDGLDIVGPEDGKMAAGTGRTAYVISSRGVFAIEKTKVGFRVRQIDGKPLNSRERNSVRERIDSWNQNNGGSNITCTPGC